MSDDADDFDGYDPEGDGYVPPANPRSLPADDRLRLIREHLETSDPWGRGFENDVRELKGLVIVAESDPSTEDRAQLTIFRRIDCLRWFNAAALEYHASRQGDAEPIDWETALEETRPDEL